VSTGIVRRRRASAHHPVRVIPAHPRRSDNRAMRGPGDKPVETDGEKPARRRREQARTVAAFGLGGLGALFAVLNIDDVDVNWIFGTWSTPLIIVIALSIAVGAGLGYLVGRRRGGD
jgi:uncharacterized integral membrane protein